MEAITNYQKNNFNIITLATVNNVINITAPIQSAIIVSKQLILHWLITMSLDFFLS
jgi:hypothetical protein